MKALRFSGFGDVTSVLHVEELPLPLLAPDEVLVKVHAASINPSDIKNVQGKMRRTTVPRTPGRDLAGVIIAGKSEMIGKEIWAAGGELGFTRDGSHADYIAIPLQGVQEKPQSLSMVEAASVGINYITAFFGLIEKAKLNEGETVLVTGASGGVGSSVVKIAKNKGARVISVDRQALETEKARRLGIDLSLSSLSDDIVNQVKLFTQDKGVDVVFDCVGGPLFDISLNSLGTGGRQVNITSVGERRVSFDLIDFYHKQLTLYGIDTLALDMIASGRILESLRPDFEQGLLTAPSITRTCSLEDAVEAYREVDSGTAKGKIVIVFPH